MGLFDYASQGFQRVAPHKKQVAGMTKRSPSAPTDADSRSRDEVLKRIGYKSISLDFLIRVQGAIKRCRELAARTSNTKLALMLYRFTDEIEQSIRELDRLELSCDDIPARVQPSSRSPVSRP
jgi:hypothetical protein